MDTINGKNGADEIIDLDHVPIDLELPPEVVASPPVVTKAQTLPCHELLWENFERLCVRLASLDGDIEHCRLYGTRGQKQDGIDLYARGKTSDKYRVYQCKRYEVFTPADINDAVVEFRKGKWFECCSHFFLCASASAVVTQLADEYERQRNKLKEDGIAFFIWDREEISRQLKTKPTIVDDFFGRAWVDEFCGQDSLTNQARLDGKRVTNFRRNMRQFYKALAEQLDPGIPIRPTQGRPTIPLQVRYVLADVQVEGSIPDVTSKQDDAATSTASADMPSERRLTKAQSTGRQVAAASRKYTQRQAINTWLAQGKNSIVAGGPGSGKTTLLRYIALEILSDNPTDIRTAPWVKLLPVWIPFGFWTKQISDGKHCNLAECVRLWLSMWNQESLWPMVEAALNDSRLLLLVDGLDEWTTIEAGRIVGDMLQVFLRTHAVTAIATTRPFGGVTLHGADWQAAEIAPLTKEQQSDLCRKWFTLKSVDKGTIDSIGQSVIDHQVRDFAAELAKSRDLAELAEVPLLLLSLIAVHFQRGVLPTDRFAAYDQLIDYLIREHPGRRRDATLNAGDKAYAPLRDTDVRLTFSYLAFSIHLEAVITADNVLTLVESFLNDSEGLGFGLKKMQARALAEQFARVAEGSSGLIIKQGFESRSFLHRSLQEYLVSFYVSKLPLKDQSQFIRVHLFEPRWREVLLGIFSNTTRQDDVEVLLEPFLVISETPTEEMYQTEFLAEVAFGPFACPMKKAKELAVSTLRRIQRHEWLPHRQRLLSHALQGLASARTRDLVRGNLTRWVYSRSLVRSWWVKGVEGWPTTPDTIDLLFDLLNDDSFDVQRVAARILAGASKEAVNELFSQFRTTLDPFRQAAIFHGLNTLPASGQIDSLIQFARHSACDQLRIEAIRARIIRSLGDESDLDDLLEIGSSSGHEFRLSEDITGLLKRGWSNTPKLKSACFNGLNTFGSSNELERSIALSVLLSAFPGDQDVAQYAAKEIATQAHPFVSLVSGVYELLSENFKDNPEVVAAIDKWAPSQQHRDPEVAHAALVGRTPIMKQILFQHLQSSVPFWAADSLIAGWGADDEEVRKELLDVAKGPAARASGIARCIPQIFADPEQARQRLRELLIHPDTRWHSQVLNTLAGMSLPPEEKNDIARLSLDLVSKVRYLGHDIFVATIISRFKELQMVRNFAVQSLSDREPPVTAVANAYGADADIRAMVIPLVSPLPLSLRSEIIQHLAKGDEDQFAVELLSDYDKEETAELKTQASVAYHRRLLADGLDATQAISYLSTTIGVGGLDMDARRQAAFAGLATLKRLDIMSSQSETFGDGPVSIKMSDFPRINLALSRVIAENWSYVKGVFGDQIENRLNKHGESGSVWEALALVAADIQEIHSEILDNFDRNERSSRSGGALSFLAKVKPRSQLLRSRCISAIRTDDPTEWHHADSLRMAVSILEEQFDNPQQLAAEIAKDRHPYSSACIALAALDPSHPFVTETWRRITLEQPVTVPEYFAVGYSSVPTVRIIAMLKHNLRYRGLLHEYNCDDFVDSVVRRIKRNPETRSILMTTLLGDSREILVMSIWRLLDRAGFLTPEQRQTCLRETNSQIRAGMVRSGFDVIAGAMRGLPLSLLDVVDRHE